MEPAALKRGKDFHKEVQNDWESTSEGDLKSEHTAVNKIDVCAGVIYPHAPKSLDLKERIENYWWLA